jgi:hypothetical protein
MSFNRDQFRDLISRTLLRMGPQFHSEEAIELLLGTAAVESDFGTYLRQVNGPARGVFQVEPATFKDIATRRRRQFCEEWTWVTLNPAAVEWDLQSAIVFARLKYYDDPDPIPVDLESQARYWKRVYNTEDGAGTVEKYLKKYRLYVTAPVGHNSEV